MYTNYRLLAVIGAMHGGKNWTPKPHQRHQVI